MIKYFINNYLISPTPEVLNQLDTNQKEEKIESVELAREINNKILQIYNQFITEEGKHIDYDGIAKSKEFKDFQNSTKLLNFVNLDDLDETQRKVFFLNIYNALTIDSYIQIGVPKDKMEKLNLIQTSSYKIGKFNYTLDEMEHGILRCNKKPPAGKSRFQEKDPRMKYCVPLDPRIHFALVCGSKSCPPVKIYSEKNLERGLDAAAKLFINDEENVKISKNNKKVELSMIFNWYQNDFEDGIINFIKKYLENPIEDLEKYQITYLNYNWDLNGK